MSQGTLDGAKKNGLQTSEATLRGHLSNGNDKKDKNKEGEDKNATYSQEVQAVYDKDYQLGRAIDLVRALFLTSENKKTQ